MKLGLCAAPIQWRKSKTKLKSNQVDLSSVKFHSHSKGKRKQYLSGIISAQCPSLSDFSFNFFIRTWRTCHVIFPWFTASHINIRSFRNI